ncbi:MAG: DUF4300 family protein [Peptostreptococcaceae bacterium]|nr:DUF4300 family protein [Peptostreptococcaceae bacterium]
MKIRKKKGTVPCVIVFLLAAMLLSACAGKEKEPPYLESIVYSNLTDEKSQAEIRAALENAGIEKKRMEDFFEEVDRYNQAIEGTSLTKEGFVESKELNPEYDLLKMTELWEAKHPDFIGCNCRITSFGLMRDFVEVGNPQAEDDEILFLDKAAILRSPKTLIAEEEEEVFENLFASIRAKEGKDISTHLETVKENWGKKQIRFRNSDKASFIFVFFHLEEEEGQWSLFVGHVGLLFPTEGGKLLFLEKLAFDEPYQALKFDNRVQLNDYLMHKYDVEWGQSAAKPFIMENDQLMEGYRPNPDNKEK